MYGWTFSCLRQKNGQREDLRVEEWKTDVPTSGNVYRWANVVVYYFTGLGGACSKTDNFKSGGRCWFNRASLLQEVTDHGTVADDEVVIRFQQQLLPLTDEPQIYGVFDALSHMQSRGINQSCGQSGSVDTSSIVQRDTSIP